MLALLVLALQGMLLQTVAAGQPLSQQYRMEAIFRGINCSGDGAVSELAIDYHCAERNCTGIGLDTSSSVSCVPYFVTEDTFEIRFYGSNTCSNDPVTEVRVQGCFEAAETLLSPHVFAFYRFHPLFLDGSQWIALNAYFDRNCSTPGPAIAMIPLYECWAVNPWHTVIALRESATILSTL